MRTVSHDSTLNSIKSVGHTSNDKPSVGGWVGGGGGGGRRDGVGRGRSVFVCLVCKYQINIVPSNL